MDGQVDLTEFKIPRVRKEAYTTLGNHAEKWSGQLGGIAVTEKLIRVKQRTLPAHQMPYLQGQEMRSIRKGHVDEKLRDGVIEPAHREVGNESRLTLIRRDGSQ